jgi:hypothetical protein
MERKTVESDSCASFDCRQSAFDVGFRRRNDAVHPVGAAQELVQAKPLRIELYRKLRGVKVIGPRGSGASFAELGFEMLDTKLTSSFPKLERAPAVRASDYERVESERCSSFIS